MYKTSSVKKLIILVTLLAVPGFLYYLLQEKGKNRYRPLPILGPKEVASTFHTKRGKQIPDTLYHKVSDFKLVNQANDTVGFPKDTTTITIVNFFFTRCPSFCKSMNNEMNRVVKMYEKNRLLNFFSITVDPLYDTPKVLAQYAKQYKVTQGKWDFLTGNQDSIYRLAKESFLVDAIADTLKADNIIHSPLLILVDPQKRLRGYYDSGNKEQVDKLIDEVKVLIAEELRKVKDR
jgi:protein SCO1/2